MYIHKYIYIYIHIYIFIYIYIRDVHGNGKCGISVPPVRFPWEWEPNCLN